MVAQLSLPETGAEIIYPDSDGQPMADNTIQFRWITIIYFNLAWLFAENPEVFVAGDLLWYPVEGNNKLRQAPDVMVAFGVAKGDRGSYQQWKENNIAPQVVFEIMSPGNTPKEMNRKLLFYDRYGVEEYYVYDPETNALTGWLRSDPSLEIIDQMDGWVSPRLGIRFEMAPDTLVLYRPDGEPFADYTEVQQKLEAAKNRAVQAENRAAQAENRAVQAENRANLLEEQLEQERQRAQKLAELLRQAGLDPNTTDMS